MPKDFYSFWEIYESDHLIRSFMKSINLKLVGPFDVLSKNLPVLNNQAHYALHWRFYFDPPEFQVNIKFNTEHVLNFCYHNNRHLIFFQTVIASSKNGFHIGYYRDTPTELPCFVANNDGENPKIIPMGENLFGALM